ncbi:MAG TPA: HmuY family protein [Gemmatimonadaceae bacterium]|nr:HmuY family protein [Gemmatimonadaceae bacterium]
MKSNVFHSVTRVCSAALILCLAACESETSGPNNQNEPAINEIVLDGPIDASSNETLTRVSLVTGDVVAADADWDIAFRRFEVRLNGGVSGSKGVLGYSMANNADATDEEVLAFTVSNTEAEFDAVREDYIPEDNEFVADRLVENKYGYLTLGGAPTANASAYWKVKTSTGGYVLFRVTAIALDPQNYSLTSISIESRVQSGASLGAPVTLTAPTGGNTLSIDLDANAAVTPSGCNWDVQVDPQALEMIVNSACNAGTFPGPSAPSFANATAANDAPEYGAYLAGMTGPIPNSFTSGEAPFRYNLEGTNKLHPTFNIYLVKVGARVYKVQLVNYYGNAGESAHPTIRYARIR